MNSFHSSLSRRSFLFSTAAAAAAPSLLQVDGLLHVSIVGFGRHAQRFLQSGPSSLLYVDAVFDPDPAALRSVSPLLQARQHFLPELVRTSRPTLIGQSPSPVLLCSPPDTWATLVPYLTAHGRPVLAHHTRLFSQPFWPESLATLSEPANLLLVGLDPSFPIRSLNFFHAFARSRGAARSFYSFWHPGWPEADLLAFHFDCLNAALPRDVLPEEHRNQWQFLPMPVEPHSGNLAGSASCSISASGPGIAFGAQLEIAEQSSSIASSQEYLLQFANFCRAVQPERNHILRRQSAVLRLAEVSREAMALFA